MKALLMIILTFLSAGCVKPFVTIGADAPPCIRALIIEMQKEEVRNPPASVWQYEYNGQTVYYIPPYCCDMYGTLYNSNCEIICHPDGGFTGKGDGRCTDFSSKRKNEKLIWKDNR